MRERERERERKRERERERERERDDPRLSTMLISTSAFLVAHASTVSLTGGFRQVVHDHAVVLTPLV